MKQTDIQRVIDALRARQPTLVVTQLVVKHPADDDGLWYVNESADAEARSLCQIESSRHDAPFLIESEACQWVAMTWAEVVEVVEAIANKTSNAALEPMRVRPIGSPEEALAWLALRGAHTWLVRHHELVLEAARELLDATTKTLALTLDGDFVLLGAALHDAGKMIEPSEMSAPGHRHEEAGEAFLAYAGMHQLSRVAVSHARWNAPGTTLEDRFVALADKLWKGKREAALEQAVIDEVAGVTGRERWEVFTEMDAIFERIASRGPARLSRSVV